MFHETFEFTEPTETKAFPLDYKREPRREIESRWVLSPEGHGETVRVTLTSSHWKDSKRFNARLSWETATTEGGFAVARWSSDHRTVSVLSDSVARYSKKALESFHADALKALEDHFLLESVQGVFAQAVEKTGLNVVEV